MKIVFVIFGLLIICIMSIPAIEALSNKEVIKNFSAGDCRIVNTDKVYKLKDANLTFYKTKEGTTHVVVFDKYGKHHDLSKSFKDLNKSSQEKINNLNFTNYSQKYIDSKYFTLELKKGKIDKLYMNCYIDSIVYLYYACIFIKTKQFLN